MPALTSTSPSAVTGRVTPVVDALAAKHPFRSRNPPASVSGALGIQACIFRPGISMTLRLKSPISTSY